MTEPSDLTTTRYVDPFLGTAQHGNCLPGPYLPFSLVRLGPDTIPPQNNTGYQEDLPILRFSHTHVSGTGGVGQYGNIGVTPFVGHARLAPEASDRRHERAEAGYYAVTLLPSQIEAELTVTPRVGVHRYCFPAGEPAHVLLDVGAIVQPEFPGYQHSAFDFPPVSTGGCVEFVSATEVAGRGDFKGGWGHGFPYSVFFFARFDRPATGRRLADATGWLYEQGFADGPHVKAVASFGPEPEVGLQVGISYVSIAQARASVDREVGGKDFDTVRRDARATWERSLSRIQVEGGTQDQRTLFYSLFTRLLCMPSDLGVDDEFPQWHSGVRHFTDFYCLWDSVRNANSLLALFDPETERDLLNCLLDIADHTGWLPDAWIAGHSAAVQGGSSADILLCEAKLKGIEGIDYERALRQMRKNNEVVSPDPYRYGRYLKDWHDLGYVSTDVPQTCVSRHLEYAYQDWCIGRLAEALGQPEVAARQYASAGKVWNLWRDDIKHFAPREAGGAWLGNFDIHHMIADCWRDPYFYEGTSWQWSFNVQHDFAGLIARWGGPEAFITHLDEFFGGNHYGYHSKETMLHVPWLYTYAGRPDRTAERVHECLAKYFHNARRGLSDNEDMGCQSAFFMAGAMGLYPMMGQDLYLLSAPLFTRTQVTLGAGGRVLTIEAPAAGSGGKYITGATLDGQALDRAWLRHAEIAGGALLRLDLSDAPGDWGRKTPPPSPMQEIGAATPK